MAGDGSALVTAIVTAPAPCLDIFICRLVTRLYFVTFLLAMQCISSFFTLHFLSADKETGTNNPQLLLLRSIKYKSIWHPFRFIDGLSNNWTASQSAWDEILISWKPAANSLHWDRYVYTCLMLHLLRLLYGWQFLIHNLHRPQLNHRSLASCHESRFPRSHIQWRGHQLWFRRWKGWEEAYCISFGESGMVFIDKRQINGRKTLKPGGAKWWKNWW